MKETWELFDKDRNFLPQKQESEVTEAKWVSRNDLMIFGISLEIL